MGVGGGGDGGEFYAVGGVFLFCDYVVVQINVQELFYIICCCLLLTVLRV